MKTKLLLLACFCVITSAFAQDPLKKVSTKYMRPSITPLYFQPKDRQEEIIISKLKSLDISSKFNDHKVDFPALDCSVKEEPGRKTLIDNYARKSTNPVMAKWWNRDAQGNFNYDFVAKSGLYSSTDADAIMAKGSNIDRREMMGEELIGKTYILLYEIASLQTMEQKYDKQDAINQNLGITKPVTRSSEGYEIVYNVYAYKLNYNDSVSMVFYNEYWTDVNNHDAAKAAKWSAATFPVNYIQKITGVVQSSQSKESVLGTNKKKKTMDELLQDIPAKWQDQALFDLARYIEDFNLKATIFKSKPLQAKLGTKESLYLDQRFFVYEIEVDQFGNQDKILKGVARAKTIENNKTIATGESKPSTFTQQGGKRLYEGMFIESHEDIGGILEAGFYTGSSDRSFGGIRIGLDYRLSRAVKKRGVYVGIDFTANYMNNVNPGIVDAGGIEIADGYSSFSGFTYSFAAKVSKEMYFTRRGNVYLNPSIGLGLVSYSLNKSDNSLYDFEYVDENGKTKHNPDYLWSSFFVPMSVGLGFYVKPNMSVELRPVFRAKFAVSTDNNDRLDQGGSYDEGWGFESLSKMSFGSSLLLNFRYRF